MSSIDVLETIAFEDFSRMTRGAGGPPSGRAPRTVRASPKTRLSIDREEYATNGSGQRLIGADLTSKQIVCRLGRVGNTR